MIKRPGLQSSVAFKPAAAAALAALSLLSLSILPVLFGGPPAGELDLGQAVIVSGNSLTPAETSAAQLLAREIEKRTGIAIPITRQWPKEARPVIALGREAVRESWAGPYAGLPAQLPGTLPAEGYAIQIPEASAGSSPVVLVSGGGPRGVLFGVGRLLRELRMAPGRLRLPADTRLVSAPRYPMRGHQMGYRPKTNSYDGWTEEIWRQYISDLVVFGTNAVEMIPPRSDDAPDSPHFPLPQLEMMTRVSRILDGFDLDVWIWYPALDPDYARPETVEAALREWGAVFARMPRLDAIFVPGGDPGHTAPKTLMAFLEKMAGELRRHHPRAGLWISPQGFTKEWMDDFLRIVQDHQPAWLAGIVHGPQVRLSLPELRAAIPQRYPIRRYPDITHSLSCQYPVPDWDLSYALTEGREGINPRPLDQAAIFHSDAKQAVGFITYSEGCNDDVNKIVWSALGWDPDTDLQELLRQYARYFIGPEWEESFANGLFALERNWRGPLPENRSVEDALTLFRRIEQSASPGLRLNWRFQQALYRAYYDAYTQRRLGYERKLEREAVGILGRAPALGSLEAMEQAEAKAWEAERNPTALDLRTRVFQLAEALFQSIRMQLSVPLYQAIDVGRGANLDTMDTPLNNRSWLREQFGEIRKRPDEEQRLREIEKLLHWEDPGPGGFYDDLGNPAAQPHLVPGPAYSEDPSFFRSPLNGYVCRSGWRLSWCDHADALFDTTLKMRYTGLDPRAGYRVRVVYAGNLALPVRLAADDQLELHPLMPKPNPVHPVEFDIPAAATRDGVLTLGWTSQPGRGSNGRGPQVAEVWLIRK